MSINIDNKIAMVPHIFPPSPSGQAVVLSRLLSGFPAESYFYKR